MRQVENLVMEAEELGARFRVEGARVTVGGPARLPEDLLAELRNHKAELIEYLSEERRESRNLSDLNAWCEIR
jgi:TubC N-terminal docking domain